MQDEQLRYSFEDKFKEDLTTYLQGKQLVDNMLPDITDMEEKWLGIAEAYLPDGMREFANYPTVSIGSCCTLSYNSSNILMFFSRKK